ncbi:anthranilate synthase family protein [Streptomyces sp. Rer75]|uniref:anthranilate synthase family protein n=1 Tax=Streptomyces sp. Rer75 TaxID=2750011 RepID=UPI0015D02B6C|nr:anthranilate synthase family protein [Streptomyces sp. Rer75]QLH21589.1 phenazine-specific anthranilate synthase [Streptomyces sp. Rer75]
MTLASAADDLLSRIVQGDDRGPYALLHRPETAGPGLLEVLVGEVSEADSLAALALPDATDGTGARHDVLAMVPYRQVAERGFAAPDDGSPLIALTVTGQQTVRLADALTRIPDLPTPLAGGHFDVDDEAYADTVRRIVKESIGEGEGANFVIKRSFVADIGQYGPHSALAFFRRLLERESGAYWTFLVHTGGRTFVGASPERHISVHDGVAVMNPVSGTYRYPPTGPRLPEVMEFLADRKETDELYMVVDEELKMMARICPEGGHVTGPYLKEMARLAHTEYLIEGRTDRDVRDVLRETLFAPTVTGSPLESACRVIARHEPAGRGYYSGVAALIGRDARGGRTLDSAILIRTADIDATGRVRIGVGATLVRHSDPDAEAAETRAKAAGLIAALEPTSDTRLASHPSVRAALAGRNDGIADFWLRASGDRARPLPGLAGRQVLVVDAEDTFTSMIAHQLRSTGLEVSVRRFDEEYSFDGHDLIVMGPGPGDPAETDHPKIAHLRGAVDTLLAERRPFLAVCLSHQVLSHRLGFPLRRRDVPNQGTQKEIDLFGARERVGFYNTFAAVAHDDKAEVDGVGAVEVSRDTDTGEVHALRGPHFASMQFHAESVLTQDGPRIVATAIRDVLCP